MKKSLRRVPGAPKSYAQPEEQPQIDPIQQQKKQREPLKQSIFEHKNWVLKEKIKLMVFLSFYQVLSDWNSERRSIYLYKHLSNFLKRARTPEQCKNIHSLLKRKFNTIQETVTQMQMELEKQQNFDKLLLKYEKEMVNFEKQNKLFQKVYEEQVYEPISSKRATEREERNKEMKMVENARLYHTTKQKNIHIDEINYSPPIKNEEEGHYFNQKRDEILQRCNFYFKQWLLYTTILEHRQQSDSQSSSS